MRVLVCHVHYAQPGGEDAVFRTEVGLLREAGVQVSTLELHSNDLHAIPIQQRARMALTYSDHACGRRLIRQAVKWHRPEVVHFHNIYPLLGPGAIAEADRLGCATLQTLHNFRLSCLTGRYVRKDDVCHLCSPGRFVPGVRHGCYRNSRLQGIPLARATTRQWQNFVYRHVPTYWLALPYMRRFYIQLGAPPERIAVKASSVDAGEPSDRHDRRGVFCGGRLSAEKGILQLMRAWPEDAPLLSVAGDGPLLNEVQASVKRNVRYLGLLDHRELRAALREALVVVMPSVWPEPLPLVTLAALAEGTPVAAFDCGSLGDLARELSPQCAVALGDFPELTRQASRLATSGDWQGLSERCVRLWRDGYSHPVNLRSLLSAYTAALAARHNTARGQSPPAGPTLS